MEWLTTENVVIAILAVLVFGWGKVTSFASSVKLPAFGKLRNKKSVEKKDMESILYLRDRAKEIGDETLLKEIKSVANKFFDIHSSNNNIVI